jgi:hypothetical protein
MTSPALAGPPVLPTVGSCLVLIGFADALAAPETAWSLIDTGARVTAFARRGARTPLHQARGISIVDITPPERSADAAQDDLIALLRSGGYEFLMPLDDAALWLCAAVNNQTDATLLGPSAAQAELALDKRIQLKAAAAAGFVVPPTQVLRSADDVRNVPPPPLVLKSARPVAPRAGRLIRGMGAECATAGDLMAAAQRSTPEEPLLAQPVIRGVGEGLFGLASLRGLEAVSAHRRIRMMNPQGSGSSACVSVVPQPDLVASAERLIRAVGWSGMFMLEFLRDDEGVPWFMEINGRPWGSMALARRAGLEYPAWALRMAIDPDFSPAASVRPGEICRHLGREIVHLLLVLRGPKNDGARWPCRLATVRDILHISRHHHWYNYRRGQGRLFWTDTLWTVRRQLLKRQSA